MVARCVALLSAALAAQVAYASDPTLGYVHVRTMAGVNIKLDGKFKGVVEGDEGLVIRDVVAGAHTLHAFLNGHEDQYAVVSVEPAAIAVLKLRPFQPMPEHKLLDGAVDAKVKSGSLWVEAIAVNATIDSKKLGWKKIALAGEPFVAANVPAGQHKLTFCNSEKCIDYRANVKADDVLALVVDFGISNIQDVTAIKKNAWARLKDACAGDRSSCASACNVELALSPRTRPPTCDVLSEMSPAMATASLASAVEISSGLEPPCVALSGDQRGWLTIRTTPAASLFYGDKKLGDTPLQRIELPAGCVELRAIAGDKEKTMRVEVDPDQVTVYAIEL